MTRWLFWLLGGSALLGVSYLLVRRRAPVSAPLFPPGTVPRPSPTQSINDEVFDRVGRLDARLRAWPGIAQTFPTETRTLREQLNVIGRKALDGNASRVELSRVAELEGRTAELEAQR